MNINSNLDLANLKIDFKSFFSNLGHYWKKIHTTIFIIFLLVSISFGIRIWQQSLNGQGWSQEKKDEYLKTNSKIVDFKEKDFNQVLGDIQSRKNLSEKNTQIRNIFAKYQ